ncbi:MAG: bifunctional acetate--CoA ligase family protein/GNAT family N-acetyltransferase, partial [Candidatus Competibacteraceae bacterium]|nr:bifunctional acetate--CoA ligase family protein/GNAT family N-acetyltransferase [Candidatus Competibacteraceae bacterium]
MSTRNLQPLFRPQSIAVIGATHKADSPAAVVIRNLLNSAFSGPVMPINPAAQSVGGVLCYASVADLPLTPDLAVICTPVPEIPALLEQLGKRGTRAAIIRTAQTKTADWEQAVLEAARPHLLRVLGPNSLGLIVPRIGLNASFMPWPTIPGRVALVHQSEALCAAMLDWARSNELGFSHFISLGDSADIDLGDVLDYLASTVEARAILLHIHSIPNARKFMSAARAAARHKPVLVVKTGRVEASARMLGTAPCADDAVFDAAIRRAGMLRVFTSDELFDAVATLASAMPIQDDRLAIITNGTGPGVIATDDLIIGGGRLAELTPETLAKLAERLPSTEALSNPVDILDHADALTYGDVLEIVLKDPQVDAVLVLHAPHAGLSSEEAAQAVIDAARNGHKTVLTSWLGGNAVLAARQRFTASGLPTYDTPDKAVRAFLHLTRYRRNQELLMETPPSLPTEFSPHTSQARMVVMKALQETRCVLSETEVRELLDAYGIAMTETRFAQDAEAAVRAAQTIGFPVAIKVLSPDISDRSEVGGVALYQDTTQAVRNAVTALTQRLHTFRPDARLQGFAIQPMLHRPRSHELRVQVRTDSTFGPVILFGQGGATGRALNDQAIALPPLNLHLARELMSRTRVFHVLEATPPDQNGGGLSDAVELTLVRVSQLIIDLPELAELTIDPLLTDSQGVLALDAVIRLQSPNAVSTDQLAIRPYPRELEESLTLRTGQAILVRPIRPEDEARYYAFHRHLTREDLFFRFFMNTHGDIPRSQMARLTQIDYDREMAFIATIRDEQGEEQMLGVVHTTTDPNNITAEYAVSVRSDLQGQGLGQTLMSKMVEYCRNRKTQEIMGYVLADNRSMLKVCDRLGFIRQFDPE